MCHSVARIKLLALREHGVKRALCQTRFPPPRWVTKNNTLPLDKALDLRDHGVTFPAFNNQPFPTTGYENYPRARPGRRAKGSWCKPPISSKYSGNWVLKNLNSHQLRFFLDLRAPGVQPPGVLNQLAAFGLPGSVGSDTAQALPRSRRPTRIYKPQGHRQRGPNGPYARYI